MDLRDFIVTPFVIMAVYAIAYVLRRRLCDSVTYRYYFPALTVKIVGALAVGFIYQFYYSGEGDTFNYHTRGSRVIWELLMDDPSAAINLIFSGDLSSHNKYMSQIVFYHDPSSFYVVRIATLFDIITFSSYTGTAVLFGFVSFFGLWCLFRTFYELFPHLVKRIAISTLFVPSVVFWGSGILKDTVVIACLGFLTWAIKRILIDRKFSFMAIISLAVSVVFIYAIKKYVLICYLPVAIFWIYAGNLRRVQSPMIRVMLFPLLLMITFVSGYLAIQKVGQNDSKYALDKIAQTATITAYDIGFYTGKNAGSSYSLGELDGSFGSLVSHLPQAINVSLFRPYLWEAKNPLMLLSSIEAFALLTITVYLFARGPLRFIKSLGNEHVLFCMVFSLSFAFAVGVSTYNFGTLNRYKIPLIPFYLLALTIIADRSKSDKKLEVLEVTE
ncbi:MAG: hypothetical protein WDO14_03825 [Bacteroidota bacterium]